MTIVFEVLTAVMVAVPLMLLTRTHVPADRRGWQRERAARGDHVDRRRHRCRVGADDTEHFSDGFVGERLCATRCEYVPWREKLRQAGHFGLLSMF